MSHSHSSSDMSGMDDMSSTSGSMTTMKMYFHGSIGSDMLWFSSWMPSSAGATVGVCIALFVIAIFERYLVAFRRACDATWQRGQIGFAVPSSAGPFRLPARGSYTDIPLPPLSAEERRGSTQKYNTLPTGSDSDSSLQNNPYGIEPAGRSSDIPGYTPTDGELGGNADEKAREAESGLAHLPRAVRVTINPERTGRWSRPFRWGVDLPRGLLQAVQTLLHYVLMLVAMSFNIWWILSIVIGAGVGEMLFGRFGPGGSGSGH